MKRFITRINGTADIELKKKQDEVSDVALRNQWQDMALYVYNNKNESSIHSLPGLTGLLQVYPGVIL